MTDGLLYLKVIDTGQLMSLSDLETDNEGQPSEFHRVFKEMLSGRMGEQVITLNARRPVIRNRVMTWTRVNSTRYFYSPLYGMLLLVTPTSHKKLQLFHACRELILV